MPGFNPENINIHDLTIEEPEEEKPELFFDPERDLTEEDWLAMRARLDISREEKDWHSFCAVAAYMKILNPSIDHHINHQEMEEIKEELRQKSNVLTYSDFLDMAMRVKIIDPSNLDLDKKLLDKIEKSMDVSNYNWATTPDRLKKVANIMAIKVLDPKINIEIREEHKQALIKSAESSRRAEFWTNFYGLAAPMRVIDPTVKFDISETDWLKLKERLQAEKDGAFHFSQQAAYMKILAAEKVEVTDKGLEINMKKPDLSSGTPEVPEQRKF